MLAAVKPEAGGRVVLNHGPQASTRNPLVDVQVDGVVYPLRYQGGLRLELAQRHCEAAARRSRERRTGKVILIVSAVQLRGPHQLGNRGEWVPEHNLPGASPTPYPHSFVPGSATLIVNRFQELFPPPRPHGPAIPPRIDRREQLLQETFDPVRRRRRSSEVFQPGFQLSPGPGVLCFEPVDPSAHVQNVYQFSPLRQAALWNEIPPIAQSRKVGLISPTFAVPRISRRKSGKDKT